jgi:hypothetical protein
MVVILNRVYDDFTAHTCWFLKIRDITLRVNSSTPNANKFDQLVITHCSQTVS